MEKKKIEKPRIELAERAKIGSRLDEGKSAYAIGKELHRPPKTIMNEIRNRRVPSDKGAAMRVTNRCAKRRGCGKTFLCKTCRFPSSEMHRCCFCNKCNNACPEYVEEKCPKLERSPYVCNGCPDEKKCTLRKYYYVPELAQANYKTILSEARSGANVTEEEIAGINEVLAEPVKLGQSLHAIFAGNADRLPICEKTAYRYVNAGMLTTKRGDLPRACRNKLHPRKGRKAVELKVDRMCYVNRTYDDYQKFRAANPWVHVTEMDTVEGHRGGKCLLTLMFPEFEFMAAILLEHKTAACVSQAFRDILAGLVKACNGDEERARTIYHALFQVVLTDRGSEFSDPTVIEDLAGESHKVNVFYCDPSAPWQKSHVEGNHLLIRRILPKGNTYLETVSFDGLTQEDASLMMSHINAYPRKVLFDARPYELFTARFGAAVADVFGIVPVKPGEVCLKPSLLGIEQKVREWITKETDPKP